MEPEPAFEVRRRSLLAFGVDLHQRRVDVQHHLVGCATGGPRFRSSLGPCGSQPVEDRVVDRGEGTPDRRRRGDLAEHVRLITQRRHVRNTAPAGREHHRDLTQQPASVVTERPLTTPRDRGRIAGCETDPIGEFTQQMGPGVRDRLAVTAGHPEPFNRACSVHLASALPVRVLVASQHQESLTARAPPRIRGLNPPQTRERSGLGAPPH